MSDVPFLGPTQEALLRAALVSHSIETTTGQERRSAAKLNGDGYLRRDLQLADLWFATDKARADFAAWGLSVPIDAPEDPHVSIWDIKLRPRDPLQPDAVAENIPRWVRLDAIDVGHRLREPDPAKVDLLKISIQDIGLRTPISVVETASWKDGPERFLLTAGAHRLEALRQLGEVGAWVLVGSGDGFDAELWEIDENLCRADLTPADRALFVFRRKEIYLMQHPETGHGGDRASRQVGDLKVDDGARFTSATAAATGRSERSLQRDAERGEKISEKALRMISGTRLDSGATLDRLKQLPVPEQIVWVEATIAEDRRVTAEAKTIRDAKRKLNREVRTGLLKAIAEKGVVRAGAMPIAAFPVIYADPPWEQEAWSDETGQDRGLPYPPMPLDDIKALCAGDKSPATRDAVLYLWVTTPRLADGLDVLKAWGFAYVSCIVWDKVHIGMGRWVRDRHEILLIGKRGDFPAPIPGTQPESVYAETKAEHSRKPQRFAADIDRIYSDLPKLELFQRKESLHFADVRHGPTWSFWGFEAGDADADPDEATTARLPPGPGPTAPAEFTVGGMKAQDKVQLGIQMTKDGRYSTSYSRWVRFTGCSGNDRPEHDNFAEALTAALDSAEDWLAAGVRDSTNSCCTDSARAAARAGLKWIAARRAEWGLRDRTLPTAEPAPVLAREAAE